MTRSTNNMTIRSTKRLIATKSRQLRKYFSEEIYNLETGEYYTRYSSRSHQRRLLNALIVASCLLGTTAMDTRSAAEVLKDVDYREPRVLKDLSNQINDHDRMPFAALAQRLRRRLPPSITPGPSPNANPVRKFKKHDKVRISAGKNKGKDGTIVFRFESGKRTGKWAVKLDDGSKIAVSPGHLENSPPVLQATAAAPKVRSDQTPSVPVPKKQANTEVSPNRIPRSIKMMGAGSPEVNGLYHLQEKLLNEGSQFKKDDGCLIWWDPHNCYKQWFCKNKGGTFRYTRELKRTSRYQSQYEDLGTDLPPPKGGWSLYGGKAPLPTIEYVWE